MVNPQLAGIITQPLLPKITIQNSALGGVYTYDPTAGANPPSSGTFDFRLKSMSFTPPSDYGVGGSFDISIGNATDSNFLNNIEQYGEVTIWLGKTASTLTKVFLGSIEHIVIKEPYPNSTSMTIQLTGPDWGSQILKNRIINYGWYQLKKVGTNDPDPTDTSTRVGTLVNYILTNSNVYPTAGAKTIQGQGVTVSAANILSNTDGGLSIPYFEANYEFVDDKLSELDSYVNAFHYIDPNKTFYQKFLPVDQSTVPDSGILLTDDYTDSVASTWASGKIGLIAPGTTYDLTSEMHKANVYGLGGNNILLDQSQQTTSGGNDNVDSQWLAVQLTPSYNNIEQISLYIAKTAGSTTTNPTDCNCQLVWDSGGKPNGTTITSFQISKDSVTPAGTAGWHTALISSSVIKGSPVWIVVQKQGDATHTYSWYKGGTGQTIATSPDGVTWTTSTGAGYAYMAYASTPLVKIAPNYLDTNASALNNNYCESVVRKPFIRDYQSMNWILAQETYSLFRYKELIKCKVYAPDTLLTIGQKVRIRKQKSAYKVDANYVVSGLEYNFQSDESGGVGSFYYDLTGTIYSTKSFGQTQGAS